MSNAPFKIAFWVMSLAFGLTILLTGLKPEEIRNALNSQKRERIEAESDEDEVADFDQIDLPSLSQHSPDDHLLANAVEPQKPLHAQAPFERSATPVPLPHQEQPAPTPRPIRVASADVNAQLGIAANELTPIPDQRFQYAATLPKEQEREILVPEPVEIPKRPAKESISQEVVHLKKEILQLRLAEARREVAEMRREEQKSEVERVESELNKLRDEIADLRKRRKEASENLTTYITAKTPKTQQNIIQAAPVETVKTIKPVDMTEVVIEIEEQEPVEKQPAEETNSVIEVTAGTKDQSYVFKFENADVREVLTTISKYAGRKVVIRPDVEGTYTGHFEETSAVQAFAAVIKANNFGVSFLGDYVLVRSHKDPKIR